MFAGWRGGRWGSIFFVRECVGWDLEGLGMCTCVGNGIEVGGVGVVGAFSGILDG